MISSWIKFWPKDYKLLVYVEGYKLKETDPRIIEIDINNECPKLLEFKKKSDGLLDLETDKRQISRIQKTVKWSHKVFVIDHALKNFKSDFYIFLDGDTYTVSPIPVDLAGLLVKNHFIGVHFESIKNHPLHFETGIIVFNGNHRQMSKFKEVYTSGYESLEIYQMDKTWDTFWLIKLYKEYDLDIIDLSKGKISGVFGNPLIYNKIIHDVGTKKYLNAGYNKFTGKKHESR
jgi:hypothetical protein